MIFWLMPVYPAVSANWLKRWQPLGFQEFGSLLRPMILGIGMLFNRALPLFCLHSTCWITRAWCTRLILSTAQKSSLWDSSGIERRRLDMVPLRWLEAELRSIVERHLAVATTGGITRLGDLCKDKGLADWLARTGGDTPRGWLEETRSVAAHYFAQGRPLTAKEWKEIRRQRPPRLSVDFEIGRVVVGRREIETIGAGELALLQYLYKNHGRVCSRAELFHKAYLPAVNPTSVTLQPSKELAKEFEGTLDTALWRLRGAIEPDPKDPLYVVTRRGQGVRLENV